MIPYKLNAITCIAVLLLAAGCGEPVASPEVNADSVSVNTRYDKDATVFSLCFLSNIVSGYVDSTSISPNTILQPLADSSMNAVLTDSATISCIGNWQIVWGPCIYSDFLTEGYIAADLTMVLLKGTDPDDSLNTMYVLSISGTNNVSAYDWLYIDLKATSMFPWPQPIQGQNNQSAFSNASSSSYSTTDTTVTNSGNYISTGMALGMKDLLITMTGAGGKTLIEYLRTNVTNDSTAELAVTGHSMGGALAPCVALSLKDNQSYWDSAGIFTITAYPFAGPSPGNANFAGYFSTTIGAENFHGWYNTNDAAPCVFNTATMNAISSMYNDVAGFPQQQCLATGIFSCMAQQLNGFNYTSLYGPGNAFTAQDSLPAGADTTFAGIYNRMSSTDQNMVDTFIGNFPQCDSIVPDSVIANFGCFGSLVIQQHFDAYRNNFHCETVFDMIQQAQGPGPGEERSEVILIKIISQTLLGSCN